jgi:FkbM family methyltransferase
MESCLKELNLNPERGGLEKARERWHFLKTQQCFRNFPLRTASRLLSWRMRCFVGRSAVITLPEWEARMILPANWRGIEKLVYAFREHYEPELSYLKKVLSPGKTFIDIGACYGIYTLLASRLVGPTGSVLSFEPASRALSVLRGNIDLNHLKNVSAFSLALSEKPGRALLFRHPNVGCDSFGRDQSFTADAEEVATDCLDNVLEQTGAQRVDLIKMDVQGAEELVLRGASNVVARMRPAVILEIWPPGPPLLGLKPYGALEFLDRLGYEFFVLSQHEVMKKITSLPSDGNVIAIPKKPRPSLQQADSRIGYTQPGTPRLRAHAQVKRSFREALNNLEYLRNHPAFRTSPALVLSRLLWWRLHCALRISATVNLAPWKARFFLPPRWRGAGTAMIFAVRQHYERELAYLGDLISPGTVVVDAGANCGIYTVAAARLVGPSGRVLSFEPGMESYSVLQKNIEMNRFQNVRAYRVALSDQDGSARLYHDQRGPASFSLGNPNDEESRYEDVPTRTLSAVLEEEAVDRVALIKLDVEGAEELILRGMKKTLICSRPKIIWEVNPSAARRLRLSPFGAWDLLKGCGYRFFLLHDSGLPKEVVTPPPEDHITNLIALPNGH